MGIHFSLIFSLKESVVLMYLSIPLSVSSLCECLCSPVLPVVLLSICNCVSVQLSLAYFWFYFEICFFYDFCSFYFLLRLCPAFRPCVFVWLAVVLLLSSQARSLSRCLPLCLCRFDLFVFVLGFDHHRFYIARFLLHIMQQRKVIISGEPGYYSFHW